MANRNYRSQFAYSYAGKKVSLHARVSFGASGAPTIVSGSGMGIASISRVSAGRYTVTLQDPYAALLGVRHTLISSSAPAAPALYVASDSSSSLSAPTMIIQFNAAGTATDPASGEVALLELIFNSATTGV